MRPVEGTACWIIPFDGPHAIPRRAAVSLEVAAGSNPFAQLTQALGRPESGVSLFAETSGCDADGNAVTRVPPAPDRLESEGALPPWPAAGVGVRADRASASDRPRSEPERSVRHPGAKVSAKTTPQTSPFD